MNIIFFASRPRSLSRFRGALLSKLVSAGHKVSAYAPPDESFDNAYLDLHHRGVELYRASVSRTSLNPIHEVTYLIFILKTLFNTRPDILVAYTIKPVVYSGIALRILSFFNFKNRIGFYPMITGLGYSFIESDSPSLKKVVVRRLASVMYKASLKAASACIFQNSDDRKIFQSLNIVSASTLCECVDGSGIDLDEFPHSPLPEKFSFLMLSRLTIEKGVMEYLEASAIVKNLYPEVEFKLAGMPEKSPSAISLDIVKRYVDEGHINYLGHVDDVYSIIASAACYVLPSYREGTPRSVLEALSVGRPIITSDVPGCRETVLPDYNGKLVPSRCSHSLSLAMISILKSSRERISILANNSRSLAETKYDVRIINANMMKIFGVIS